MSGLPVLTPRQLDVLHYRCLGLSCAQVADRLGIAPQTVRNHTTDILARFWGERRPTANAVNHLCMLYGMAIASRVLDPDGTGPLRPGDV